MKRTIPQKKSIDNMYHFDTSIDMKEKEKKMVAFVLDEDFRKLKGKLSLEGRTVSDFVREAIKKEIGGSIVAEYDTREGLKYVDE